MSKHITLFDAHFHIIDDRFPLVENNGYLPDIFTCNHYLSQLKNVDLIGGAVISGSFQAYDHSYIEDALSMLGPRFVGVVQIHNSISDEEIIRLKNIGVRGARFNIVRGKAPDIDEIINIGIRVYEVAGWHTELYITSKYLKELYTKLVKLPLLCIDHLGINKVGFYSLLNLAEKDVRVKASGFGRVNFDVVDTLQQLYSVNNNCLMFGTDLPSTRASRPFNYTDIETVSDNFDRIDAENILYKNAVDFYKIE